MSMTTTSSRAKSRDPLVRYSSISLRDFSTSLHFAQNDRALLPL